MLCPVDWAAVFFALKRLRSLNLYKRCGTKKDRVPDGGVRAASRHSFTVMVSSARLFSHGHTLLRRSTAHLRIFTDEKLIRSPRFCANGFDDLQHVAKQRVIKNKPLLGRRAELS